MVKQSSTAPVAQLDRAQAYEACTYPVEQHSKRIPPAVRFWRHVEKTDGCWNWTGALNSAGYGTFGEVTHPVHTVLAHRFSVQLATGAAVPADKVVRHACDNRRCVRPDHLQVGSVAENNQDMHDRGRHPGCSGRQRDGEGRLLPRAGGSIPSGRAKPPLPTRLLRRILRHTDSRIDVLSRALALAQEAQDHEAVEMARVGIAGCIEMLGALS